jgi:hypothetical protein
MVLGRAQDDTSVIATGLGWARICAMQHRSPTAMAEHGLKRWLNRCAGARTERHHASRRLLINIAEKTITC